jgi:HlyD family secretion protein
MAVVTPSRIIAVGILVVVVAAVVVTLRPRPIEADFVTVARGPLQVTIDEEGETRVRERFVVSAPVAGRVLRIELEPGDPVEAGKTALATFLPADPALLDPRTRAELEARVKAAEADVGRERVERERAATELQFAETELKRQVELYENALIPKERLDAAELRARTAAEALRSAEFAVQNAEHELEVARAGLLQGYATTADGAGTQPASTGPSRSAGNTITLRSPINGVVLRRLRESEAVVPPGEPLLEVADPTRLEIVSDLLSTDAVKIKPGDKVLIEQWGGDRALKGRVRRIEPYGFTKISALGVEEQRVNVIVDFEDVREAWEELGDGYRVEVRIVIWEHEDVLKVPTSSLFRQGDQWAVFVVQSGLAALRMVEVGQRTGFEAEVLAGLEEGAQVIAYPSDEIGDGTAVVPRST